MFFSVPANEIIWERVSDIYGRPLYCITSTRSRDTYYIYRVYENGKTEKLGKAKDPPELYEKFVNKNRRA